jgi:hypothetical protein
MERGERPIGETAARRLADYYNISAEAITLAYGQVPEDVVAILRDHPEELDNLRQKHGSSGDSG